MKQAVDYINTNLADKLTLVRIAGHVRLSPSRLWHLFKRELGDSPAAALKSARLTEARMLLETSDLSIKEVMTSVGYTDASHFARDFKKAFGLTPRQLRNGRPCGESRSKDRNLRSSASPDSSRALIA